MAPSPAAANTAHEKLSNPAEYMLLISERLVDFIRFRVSKVGGITPAKKIAAMAELYGVRTAFQEGADNDPVNFAAAMHLDTGLVNFGIQEEITFPKRNKRPFRALRSFNAATSIPAPNRVLGST